MIPDNLFHHPLLDHFYSTSSPAASPTATLDTILIVDFFLVRLYAAYFDLVDS